VIFIDVFLNGLRKVLLDFDIILCDVGVEVVIEVEQIFTVYKHVFSGVVNHILNFHFIDKFRLII